MVYARASHPRHHTDPRRRWQTSANHARYFLCSHSGVKKVSQSNGFGVTRTIMVSQ
jgi:hypothetical protein